MSANINLSTNVDSSTITPVDTKFTLILTGIITLIIVIIVLLIMYTMNSTLLSMVGFFILGSIFISIFAFTTIYSIQFKLNNPLLGTIDYLRSNNNNRRPTNQPSPYINFNL